MKRQSALVPAAARGPTHLVESEVDLSAAAVETFTTAVGGRDALVEVLSVADRSADVARVLDYLLDPRYETWSLRRLCSSAGITIADLFTAYRKALIAKAGIEASRVIADKLVDVVRDVMARAAPYEVPCGTCSGTGTVSPTPDAAPQPCATCRGQGRVLALPDLDRQKLALELGHLTQKSGGIFLQQNAAFAANPGANAPGTLEQLQQAVGEILSRPSREPEAVEGQTTDDQDPERA